MTTPPLQQRVSEFMEAAGFRFDKVGRRWIAPQGNPWKLYAMDMQQATFMYRLTLEARRHELAVISNQYSQKSVPELSILRRIEELGRLLEEES